MPAQVVDELDVEAAVAAKMEDFDPQGKLRAADFQDVLMDVTRRVVRCMRKEERSQLDDEDLAYIAERVQRRVTECLDAYALERSKPTRFHKFERVVCNVGGERMWASGKIQSLNEDDPEDPTGQTKLPYVVKTDPPAGRLISVPKDDYDVVRAEVCFGRRAGALWFTLFCAPQRVAKAKRFGKGARVACAVEDSTNDFSIWAAGTVIDVDYTVEQDLKASDVRVPYRVQLDLGDVVLVHRDEHWLVRDLALQMEGPRQSADGLRCLTRIEKRKQKDDSRWEVVDHETCKVRPCEPPSDDELSDTGEVQ